MSALTYPQYQVAHGTYTPSGTESYVILSVGGLNGVWTGPANFAALVTRLNLQAATNLQRDGNGNYVAFAYTVGVGAGFYSTAALAKAAAQADYQAIWDDKNAQIEAQALQNPLNNPYYVLAPDSPVSGPG